MTKHLLKNYNSALQKKKIYKLLKIRIFATKATNLPPVGPTLSQYAVNTMEFIKAFNDATLDIKEDVLLNVLIIIYKDRSFVFTIRRPTIMFFIKQFLLERYMNKTTMQPEVQLVANDFFNNKTITKYEVLELAKLHAIHFKTASSIDLFQISKTVVGQLKASQIKIKS